MIITITCDGVVIQLDRSGMDADRNRKPNGAGPTTPKQAIAQSRNGSTTPSSDAIVSTAPSSNGISSPARAAPTDANGDTAMADASDAEAGSDAASSEEASSEEASDDGGDDSDASGGGSDSDGGKKKKPGAKGAAGGKKSAAGKRTTRNGGSAVPDADEIAASATAALLESKPRGLGVRRRMIPQSLSSEDAMLSQSNSRAMLSGQYVF